MQALRGETLAELASGFGEPLHGDPDAALVGLKMLASTPSNPVRAAALVSRTFFDREPRQEPLAHFLADVVLADRLGWQRPLPLLAWSVAAPSLRAGGNQKRSLPNDPHWEAVLFGAYALSAERTLHLASELGRKADSLAAVAPKLRAKGSDRVVAALLEHAYLAGSRPIAGMSDRAMRRIFDRLVEVRALREVSGRSSFRIYGL